MNLAIVKRSLWKLLPVGIVVFLASLSIYHLLKPGLPPTHDGEYHVIRFHQFNKTLLDGDWYPRWEPDLYYGYGVPLLNYYYPFANYVASALHIFRVSFIDAVKLNMVIATLLGAFFFYIWTKMYWGKVIGIVCATCYIFSPYYLLNLYIRGSVGEVWALSLFPAFLWSITKLLESKKKIFIVLSSLFLAAVIFSHNILALLFFPFALSYVIMLLLKKRSAKRVAVFLTLTVVLLGLGLSAIFWLPALLERQYVRGLQIFDPTYHFPEIYQLIFPSWGSGFSGAGLQGEMSFQIGVINLLIVLLSIAGNKKHVVSFFLIWFFILIFLMLRLSLPIWQNVPLMQYIQFPWRLLSLVILIASFLAGSVLSSLKQRLKSHKTMFIVAIFIAAGAILSTITYAKPAYYHQRSDTYYTGRSNFMDSTNTPGNALNTIWMQAPQRREKEKIAITRGEGKVKVDEIRSTKYTFTVVARSKLEVLIRTAYFPGWAAFVNGRRQEVVRNEYGLFTVLLPEGNHRVEVRLTDTAVRMIGSIITAVSFMFVLLLVVTNLFRSIIKR